MCCSLWSKVYNVLWWALDPIVILWPAHHAWMGVIVTNVISSVGHQSLDSVGLLMIDGSLHIWGTDVVLQVPRDNANPPGKWLISKPYGIELWHDSLIIAYIISILHPWSFCQKKNYNLHWCMWFINNRVHHMITCHHAYYYSLSHGLTHVYFSHVVS
jgi:hypothetical protein